MPINNFIVRWIVIGLLAFGYGALVQKVLGYTRGGFLLTVSIGAVGIAIAEYLLPGIINIHSIFNIGGIPLISSLVGSFIIPGAMWLLRKDGPIFNSSSKRKNRDDD